LLLALEEVEYYLVDYGQWGTDWDKINLARTYDLVVMHPNRPGISADIVQTIKQGVDPDDPADDVIVLGYISVGEDLRTVAVSDSNMKSDSRFSGNQLGPRIDPRGWAPPSFVMRSLAGIDPMGSPSTGGLGYWSFYVDDNDVYNSANHVGNGIPDRNPIFGGSFVNAGDPNWFDVLQQMSLNGPDQLAGLQEIMTTSFGKGLGCDGIFMDTIDTCAPNYYTDESSPNESKFEWTAPGFTEFIAHVHATYPDKLLLQNRGVFFFDPRKEQYKYNARSIISLNMFESFYLDSNPTHLDDPYFYPDNRYNVAPKLFAEANRADGFVALSLDYAEGPPGEMSYGALFGQSTVGLAVLQDDVHMCMNDIGFKHYITNGAVNMHNSFVRNTFNGNDQTPPQWTSTYNANVNDYPTPSGPPAVRVGIQAAVVAGPGTITVSWDSVFDLNKPYYRM